MGAHLETYPVTKNKNKDEITKGWNEAIDQDQYDHGHDGYSGSIQTMGKGLTFKSGLHETKEAAEDYIADHHEKWNPAIAVQVMARTPKGRIKKVKGKPVFGYWLIGGWVAE